MKVLALPLTYARTELGALTFALIADTRILSAQDHVLNSVPQFFGLLAQSSSRRGKTDWVTIIVIALVVVVLGVIAYLVIASRKKGPAGDRAKKRSGGVTVSETHVD